MEDFEQSEEKGLTEMENTNGEQQNTSDFGADFRAQAEDFGKRINDAAIRAKEFASEKFAQAENKFNELKDKDPREIVENAKEYTRQNPGQALLITAAVGVVIGMILRGRRKSF